MYEFRDFAPVTLFLYNRPTHTEKVLDALSQNELIQSTDIYIFCDAAKKGATLDEINQINKVRELAKNINWGKTKHIIVRENNFGLSRNIISGIDEVLSTHKKIIVLEDDLVTSRGFLTYMNEALDLYESEEQVGCIHGWNYSFKNMNYPFSTFFLPGADCWGWGTWKRAWDYFEPSGPILLNKIIKSNKEYNFNRRGTVDFIRMLKDQIEQRNDSWAIRWHASLFLEKMYCLHPIKSLVLNIGLDGSGVHCGVNQLEQHLSDEISIQKMPVIDSDWFYDTYRKNRIKDDRSIFDLIKYNIRKIFSRHVS